MFFDTGFENGERVNVTDVSWEGAPDAGRRAAKGSTSNGGQADRWYSEVDGRRRAESAGACVDLQELGKVKGSEIMDGLKGMEQNLKNNAAEF